MRHARADDLEPLAPLLQELRALGLREKSPGVFYRNSRPFFHVHVHDGGLIVDVRLAEEFERFSVDSADQQQFVLDQIRLKVA